MRWVVSIVIAIIALTGSFAAAAQEVLDRVEPTRIEERKVGTVEGNAETVVEVERPRTSAAPDGTSIFVGGIEITGISSLKNSYFSDIIQSYMGRTLNSKEVEALTDKLATRARGRFPFASARVAPQELEAGILRVEIDEGRLDEIELKGFENRRIALLLNSLATGTPVTAMQLERVLLLARDVDGVRLQETTVRREGDRNILVVKGIYDRFRGQISFDNDSTKPIGPYETFGYIQANGLLSHDDSLQAYVLSALPQPEELAFVRVRYANRIDNAGTELSVAGSVSRSEPGSYLAPLDIVGQSWMASVGLARPLQRTVRSSLWIDASMSLRQLRQQRAGNLSRRDRLAVARVGLAGTARIAGGTVQSRVTVSRGLPILGASRMGDPMSSGRDADGIFTAATFSAQWSRPIAGKLGTMVAVRSQIADRPLLVSEEIGLGGARFGRGYDYSERSGDQGAMGYLEINYDLDKKVGPFAGIKPYVFVDGGKVSNLSRGSGGGTLVSTGGGMGFDVDRWTDASLEVAAPLSGNRYETGSQSPRIRFSLTRYF